MKESTASQILNVAEQIVQTQGYNAFSYADISARVGIRKASIHYHFPSKHDLGRELILRYRYLFGQKLQQIELATNDPKQQLLSYVQLYKEGLVDDRLCLCNMLAADYVTLPQPMQRELQSFFIESQAWLTGVLKRGSETGVLRCHTSIDTGAKVLIAGLQGAQLMSRVLENGLAQFETIAQGLLSGFIVNLEDSSEILTPAPFKVEVPTLH